MLQRQACCAVRSRANEGPRRTDPVQDCIWRFSMLTPIALLGVSSPRVNLGMHGDLTSTHITSVGCLTASNAAKRFGPLMVNAARAGLESFGLQHGATRNSGLC